MSSSSALRILEPMTMRGLTARNRLWLPPMCMYSVEAQDGIVTDFALVRAARGDRHGNLSYDASARNFNPLCAMAGKVTIAEVEELVELGELDPEHVDTPGVFVQRVVVVGEAGKLIEKQTVRTESAG